jgi:hypothetical protein
MDTSERRPAKPEVNEDDPLGSGDTHESDVDGATERAIEQGIKDHANPDKRPELPDERERAKTPT